jgi:excisionase family DNA binding protein
MSSETSNADVLTAKEAAAMLRRSVGAVRQLSAAGEIPGRRIGGTWRYSRSALNAWLAGQQVAGGPVATPSRAARSDTFVPATRDRFAGRI